MICHAMDAVDEAKGGLSPLERVTQWKHDTKNNEAWGACIINKVIIVYNSIFFLVNIAL